MKLAADVGRDLSVCQQSTADGRGRPDSPPREAATASIPQSPGTGPDLRPWEMGLLPSTMR